MILEEKIVFETVINTIVTNFQFRPQYGFLNIHFMILELTEDRSSHKVTAKKL